MDNVRIIRIVAAKHFIAQRNTCAWIYVFIREPTFASYRNINNIFGYVLRCSVVKLDVRDVIQLIFCQHLLLSANINYGLFFVVVIVEWAVCDRHSMRMRQRSVFYIKFSCCAR